METAFLGIAFVIFSILIVVALYIILSSKAGKEKGNERFISALIDIVEGNKSQAIDRLKALALDEPDNVYAVALLGDLLRENGELSRALRIHLPLLKRKGLDKDKQMRIMKSLALDYHCINDDARAVEVATRALSIDNSDPFFIEFLLEKYEQMSNWEKAFEMLERLERTVGVEDNRRKAYIKLGMGLEQAKNGDGHKARLAFKEAIKLDPNCHFAYKFIASSYSDEKRWDDAIEWYKRFIELFPDKSYMVVQELEKSFFEKGRFQDVIEVYREILSNEPENKYVVYRLAHIYAKMGNYENAINIIENSSYRSELASLVRLLEYNKESGNIEKINPIIDELVKLIGEKKPEFVCSNCGTTSDEEIWRCPNCKGIYTFKMK